VSRRIAPASIHPNDALCAFLNECEPAQVGYIGRANEDDKIN